MMWQKVCYRVSSKNLQGFVDEAAGYTDYDFQHSRPSTVAFLPHRTITSREILANNWSLTVLPIQCIIEV